jgi:hypothetical protein
MPGPFHYQILDPLLYSQEPAPVCELIVSWRRKTKLIRALIDSGAGETYLPLDLIRELALRKIGDDVEVSGAVGEDQYEELYAANLDLGGIVLLNFPIISNKKRAYAIIGRDFIKRYMTTLDGPNQEFTLT